MGASIQDSGGHRGKRPLDAEINLVPFIDLLCSLISFLLMTAVWMQISSLELKQGSEAPEDQPEQQEQVQLKIHIHERGFTLMENEVEIPIACTAEVCNRTATAANESGQPETVLQSYYDYTQLEQKLKEEKDKYQNQKTVAIVLADGIPYNEMIKTMDTCIVVGLDGISLSGTML